MAGILPLVIARRTQWDAMSEAARRSVSDDVLRRFVQTVAQHSPLLLTVEEVHWADAVALAPLRALASARAQSPLALVVGMGRIDGGGCRT
jgi:predicted ATPase